ncbi:MAG: ExeA family protein [Terriglobales bacterium]
MESALQPIRRHPFALSPDPAFLCPTPAHDEALAGLVYGVRMRQGIMALTGEVGTGKTLVLRCLMRALERHRVLCCYLFHSLLSGEDLLRYLLAHLGEEASQPMGKADVILRLSSQLLRQHRAGWLPLLIIDEAQDLSPEALEEVRLLTNLETAECKLLQVVLAGQPELDGQLDSHRLRQLKQRVAMRFHLPALTQVQTRAYVARRLQLAGAEDVEFTPAALDRVHEMSQGIPRVINLLCGGALLLTTSQQQLRIGAAMVDEVAADLRLCRPNASDAPSGAAAVAETHGPDWAMARSPEATNGGINS